MSSSAFSSCGIFRPLIKRDPGLPPTNPPCVEGVTRGDLLSHSLWPLAWSLRLLPRPTLLLLVSRPVLTGTAPRLSRWCSPPLMRPKTILMRQQMLLPQAFWRQPRLGAGRGREVRTASKQPILMVLVVTRSSAARRESRCRPLGFCSDSSSYFRRQSV